MLRRFLDANARLSARIAPRLESDHAFFRRFDDLVAEAANALPRGSLIVDLGGGRRCHFVDAVDRSRGARIVAVDVSAEELTLNEDVDETRPADVVAGLPFADGEVDLLVSRTLLEHVDGVPRAVANMARVLRPGATTLHLVPCRWALFAIVARVVPFRLAKRLLHVLHPSLKGIVEFEVYYDHCEPRTLERVFRVAGFREVTLEICWGQAAYAAPMFPVFLLVAAYQELTRRLRLRRLAAYVIVRAVR